MIMLTRLIASLSALLILVAATPVPSPTPQWSVDQSRSALKFSVTVEGQEVAGKFKAFGSLIAFDPAKLSASSVKITMDMSEAKTGNATRDSMLLNPDWFNILDFPQAIFEAKNFVHKGADNYLANGTLTLKGKTRPLSLPFTLKITGNTAFVTGAVTLKRLDFGVGHGRDFSSNTPVALDVKVSFNLEARRRK